MDPSIRSLMLASAIGLTPSGTAAATPDAVPTPEFSDGFPVTSSRSIYELDEVRRGDRGIGYTVFESDQVEPFQVEVLGLMEDMLGPGGDVILTRLSGERIEYTGVISGMSGSPVYIDGRLVGAVAYRFGSFTREPIAGITPIRSMMSSRSVGADPRARSTRPISREGLGAVAIHGRDPSWVRAVTPAMPQGTMVPIPLPMSAAGVAPAALEVLRGRVGSPALHPVASGAGTSRGLMANAPSQVGGVAALPIAPATPIAASLVTGDLNISAIGTVTFVEDGRVLAFGHPFVGLGRVAFPMATAGILNTLASEAGSYKQGIAARQVGVIRDDRLTAIAGALGQSADLVPLVVRFRKGDGPTQQTDVQIVDDPAWLSTMVEAVVGSALGGRLDLDAGGTVDAEIRVRMPDRAIEIRDMYSAPPPVRVTFAVGADAGSIVGILARNDLEPANIEGVEVEARYRPEVRIRTIVAARPERTVVEAGTELAVQVDLRDHLGAVRQQRITLPVPPGARGTYSVYVGGGFEFDREQFRKTGRRVPRALDDLLVLLAERRPTRNLVAGLFGSEPSVLLGSTPLNAPPPSWTAMLPADGRVTTKKAKASLTSSSELELDAVVDGGISFDVVVQPGN